MIKNNDLKINVVKNKKELEQVFKIRETIFIKEQNVPFDIERDKFDSTATHVLVFYENKPLGCARVRFVGKKAKLERIAILKKYRGKGYGKFLINFLESYCEKIGIKYVYMNSQYYLKDYYSKFGFKSKGGVFLEAGIKHIKMYK